MSILPFFAAGRRPQSMGCTRVQQVPRSFSWIRSCKLCHLHHIELWSLCGTPHGFQQLRGFMEKLLTDSFYSIITLVVDLDIISPRRRRSAAHLCFNWTRWCCRSRWGHFIQRWFWSWFRSSRFFFPTTRSSPWVRTGLTGFGLGRRIAPTKFTVLFAMLFWATQPTSWVLVGDAIPRVRKPTGFACATPLISAKPLAWNISSTSALALVARLARRSGIGSLRTGCSSI